MITGTSISKNYAVELGILYKIREFKDGINFFQLDTTLDLYKGDHNPKFQFILIILNFMIIQFEIYNKNHYDDGNEEIFNADGIEIRIEKKK